MKKAIFTLSLFAMMMVLTSFTTPEKDNMTTATIFVPYSDQGGNGQQLPKKPKELDYDQGGNGQQLPKKPKGLDYDQGGNGQQLPKKPKGLDIF